MNPNQRGVPRTHGLYTTREITCRLCGKPFTINRPLAKYCSDACRIQGTMYGRMTYRQREPNRRAQGYV